MIHQTRQMTPKIQRTETKSQISVFLLAFFCVFGGQIFGCGGAALRNPWFSDFSENFAPPFPEKQ